jgi:hypothetical protein
MWMKLFFVYMGTNTTILVTRPDYKMENWQLPCSLLLTCQMHHSTPVVIGIKLVSSSAEIC